MFESSKAAKRRYYNSNFATKYFVGNGIDVGCGPDPLAQYSKMFPLMGTMKNWDIQDGDAQYLESVQDDTYDFLHSSHSLEHMQDPYVALTNWIGVVKPNGYIILTVPDEDLYEHGHWPSQFSNEHFWSFTICKANSNMPNSINVVDLITKFADQVVCEKIELITDFHRDVEDHIDQTLLPNTECAIEIILRKK